jgi:hypothetical protein
MRAILVCSLVVTSGCAMWDGGFLTAEYRFHVKGANGAPIAGARMRVLDADDKPAFIFPIEEHREKTTLVSDAAGTITVHHVSMGLEFGGTCMLGFIGTCSEPKFTLRFTDGDRAETVDFGSLMPANTTAGVDAFNKLPRAKTTLSMELERAYFADSANAATLRPRVLAAWQTNDRAALAAPTPVTLDFPVIDRDVIVLAKR